MKDLWELSLVEEDALRLLEVRFGGPAKHWIDVIRIERRRCIDLVMEKHTPSSVLGLWSAKYSLIVKMAFCNRFASIMRQTISQNSASIGQVPTASMLNAIRCMSSSKLFIGGLSYGTDDQSLRDAFSGFGDVVDAKVITDRETGKSRGFGFVNFTSDESATSAMSSMDGQPLDGRTVRVSYATERPSSGPRGNFGGGYSSGNYRGGYGDARENDRF
ncbi:hypothetical protein LOK49_LG08G02296 [Camellia lanceoleosa]|uniref:Uncharacterized protein n=1 Tax=Camellia lanceoleosa TaxID=1840588 RepID=A0ACC0GVD9_9ERIC|nr:hypothetical protein LOK49_LG08G02296 [Camellia lanceoleosa]